MKVTFLGTGTSTGVPQIGCTCKVCTSTDPRDKRLRCSVIAETAQARVLIDCGPDFRQQMLRVEFKPFDAVFITHEHYDHVGGLDDLRPFAIFGNVNVYANDFTASHLEERMPYCFAQKRYPGVPEVNLVRLAPHDTLSIHDIKITAIKVMHAELPILGFRLNNLAYITDMKTLPDTELPYLNGVEVLIINGLRHEWHYSHQTIEAACEFAKKIGVKQAYITHMGHHIDLHVAEDARLPKDIHLAYDGLQFDC